MDYIHINFEARRNCNAYPELWHPTPPPPVLFLFRAFLVFLPECTYKKTRERWR